MVRAEPVWDPARHSGSWRAVWAYKHSRALRDRRTLALQEERARAVVAGERPAKNPRFVTTTGDGHSIDEASLARAQQLVGLKGYVTNIPASTKDPRALFVRSSPMGCATSSPVVCGCCSTRGCDGTFVQPHVSGGATHVGPRRAAMLAGKPG